jgi:hypothetical protein
MANRLSEMTRIEGRKNDLPGKNRGVKRQLKATKRYEAMERNAQTPYERTKRYRKALARAAH